jgi:hypothetical protein
MVYNTQRYWVFGLCPSSGFFLNRIALSKGPNRVGVFPHLRTETDPVSKTLYFFIVILEKSGRWTKSENPISLNLSMYLSMALQPFVGPRTPPSTSVYPANSHSTNYSLSFSIALQPFGPWPLFQFLDLYTVGRTPWNGDQPVARPLPTHTTTQTQNKRTHTFMPQVGFEPTIQVFELAKTVHASDHAAIVIGMLSSSKDYFT